MKKKLRILIDITMVILLPLLMAYSLVGEAAHEYLGIAMFLLFVIHNILNMMWWKNIFHGKYNAVRIIRTIVNFVLVIIMLSLTISGIIMSRHAFNFLHFSGSFTARPIHILASYWGLVLMSFHAGMHGYIVIGKNLLKNKTGFTKLFLKLLIAFLIIAGTVAFKRKNIAEYLFLRSQFVFIDFSQAVVFAILDYLFIISLFMIIGYYITRILLILERKLYDGKILGKL